MTPLITLPNGNAVRPDKVLQVNYLPKDILYPDRVCVAVLNGLTQLINCDSPEEARRVRDMIIDQVNEAMTKPTLLAACRTMLARMDQLIREEGGYYSGVVATKDADMLRAALARAEGGPQ